MNLENIHNLYNNISESISWVERNDISSNEKKIVLQKLKDFKKDVNRLSRVFIERPAAAAFGESQMGKSYFIENLLSDNKSIEDSGLIFRDETNSYNFKKEINPIGDNFEATGLLSRFTILKHYTNENFPVTLKLFNIRDVIILLIEAYFGDVKYHEYDPQIEDIIEFIKSYKKLVKDRTIKQSILSEDDILEIQEYVNTNFSSSNTILRSLERAKFWQQIGEIIHLVNENEWNSLFSIVWGYNSYIDDCFKKSILVLKKLNYQRTCFTNFKSLLLRHSTLLHVNRLLELGDQIISDVTNYSEDYLPNAEIYFKDCDNTLKSIEIRKSSLSLVTQEVIFKIEESMTQTREFLNNFDLLDFPGARAREEIFENQINKDTFPKIVLRGKVGYYFNKYSNEKLIGILLIAATNKKRDAPVMPQIINTWIESFIGKTELERTKFLSGSFVPPLFLVMTKFDLDLLVDPIKHNKENLSERWNGRFNKLFLDELADSNRYNWPLNWTNNEKLFGNFYFLRSWEYSTGIFKGFVNNLIENEYADLNSRNFKNMEDLFSELKTSFLNFSFVARIPYAEKLWDESATFNKNGSRFIIEQLNNTNSIWVRQKRYEKIFQNALLEIQNVFKEIYEDGDADKLTDRKVTEALNLQGYLNALISDRKNPFFFGDFIEALMLSESEVFNFFRERFENLDVVKASNIDRYLYFRTRSPRLNTASSRDEKLIILKEDYKKDNIEETIKYFKSMQINLDLLFDMNRNTIKNASVKLAEDLKNYWFEKHLGIKEEEKGNLVQVDLPEKFNKIISYGLQEDHIRLISQNLAYRFNQISILNDISDDLAEFVDNERSPNILELIADNGRARINNFVNNFGWDKYNEDAKTNLARIVQSQKRDTLVLPRIPTISTPTEDGVVAALVASQQYAQSAPIDQFNSIDAVPIVANTKRWIDFMQMSFLVDCETGTRDPEENRKLGAILEAVSIQNNVVDSLEL